MFLPIFSILKILATLIGAFVTFEGYKKWKKTKLLSMEYFWKAMLWHSLDCVTIMIMPLVSFNLYFIQTLWNLNLFTGTIYYAYLLALLLLFLETERFQRITKNFLIMVAPLNLGLGILFLKPAIIQVYSLPFGNLNGITWQPNLPSISVVFAGLGVASLFLVLIPLLTKKVFSLKDSLARQKGMCLISGVAGLFLAAIFNWLVGPRVGYSFWKDVIQGLLCSSGQIFFALGILLEKK